MTKPKRKSKRATVGIATATAKPVTRRAAVGRLRTALAAVVALVAVGLWAYSTSFAGVFVFDDIGSIVDNPHIKSLWPITRAMSSPQDVTVAGRPIASLTLALNYALAPADARDILKPPGPDTPPDEAARFLRNVWGYHALNLAVHLLAAVVLFGVVRRSLAAPPLRDRFGRAAALLAFVVALVWMVHPVQTESVTYVVQRVESLMGLFFLLTLYCAIRAAEPGSRRLRWTAGSIAACALGMGSKEVMVTAPAAVVLWDLLVGKARSLPYGKVAAERWPLYAGMAGTWIIVIALAATNPRPHSAGFALGQGWTWWTYLETQAGVVAHYLRLAVVPDPLVFDYAWEQATSFSEVAPAALLLVALFALTVFGAMRRHPAAFLGAWFFLILAPTSSVLPIPTEVAAEHRMYLPVAAIVAGAVLSTYAVGSRVLTGRRRVALVAGLLVAGAIAAVFAGSTRARNDVYASDEALMRDTVEKRPGNARARVAYGADLLAARRFAEAETELKVAVGLRAADKTLAQAHMYLGSALCAQGRIAEGIPHLQAALAGDPSLGEAYALIGEAYASQGHVAPAVEQFSRALQALPDNVPILRRVAWLLATSTDDRVRNGARALELAERATRLTGRQDVLSLESLAAAHAEQGRFAEASAVLREALALAQGQGNGTFVRVLQNDLAVVGAGRPLR